MGFIPPFKICLLWHWGSGGGLQSQSSFPVSTPSICKPTSSGWNLWTTPSLWLLPSRPNHPSALITPGPSSRQPETPHSLEPTKSIQTIPLKLVQACLPHGAYSFPWKPTLSPPPSTTLPEGVTTCYCIHHLDTPSFRALKTGFHPCLSKKHHTQWSFPSNLTAVLGAARQPCLWLQGHGVPGPRCSRWVC